MNDFFTALEKHLDTAITVGIFLLILVDTICSSFKKNK